MQPPNQQAVWIVGGAVVAMAAIWFGFERKRFQGPPQVARALVVAGVSPAVERGSLPGGNGVTREAR